MLKEQQPPSLFTSFPEELVVDIIARVPRCYYPSLSLVSKHFRSLVASPEIYTRRSILGCSEHCVYVAMFNNETKQKRLYTLLKEPNSNSKRLVLVPSFPAITINAKLVAVGSKIYVASVVRGKGLMISVDCSSHKVQQLPSLPTPMYVCVSAAAFINGKIYVVLSPAKISPSISMIVFDTETQMWEARMIIGDIKVGYLSYGCCVVMADNMYMADFRNTHCLVYMPKESKWEREEKMLSVKKWLTACVLDNILYYYDVEERKLGAYDPKHKCSIVVKGVEELWPEGGNPISYSKTVSYGRKLAVFFGRGNSEISDQIWCAEIAVEKRQGGEIWGKVEWCEVVIEGRFDFLTPVAAMV